MTTEKSSTPGTSNATANPVPITVTPSGLKGLKLFEREIATYRRELPRLLSEGEASRYAIVKGDDIVSIWDTWGDATQARYERFGMDSPIFIKQIDERDMERFALLDAWMAAQCQH